MEFYSDDISMKHDPPAPLCLILSPTRELALQTEREARKFAFDTPIVPCKSETKRVTDNLIKSCVD